MKPDWKKIVIFVVLIVIVSIPNLATYCPGCTRESHGFPLGLYELPGCEPTPPTFKCPEYRMVYSGLVVDIVFWYLISCLIIRIYYKIRKK